MCRGGLIDRHCIVRTPRWHTAGSFCYHHQPHTRLMQAASRRQHSHLLGVLLQQVVTCGHSNTQKLGGFCLHGNMHNPRFTSTKGSCISDSVRGPCASTTSNVVASATTAGGDASNRLLLGPAASPLLTACELLSVLLVWAEAAAQLAGLLLLAPADDLRQRLKKLPLLLLVVVLLLGCFSVLLSVGTASWPCCTWQMEEHTRAESSRGVRLWM